MPRFSQESLSKLSQCHMDLQVIFFEVIKSFDCTILEGHRNEEDQNKAYHDGKSRLQWPNGMHNGLPSLAVDVAPYPLPDWRNVKDFLYFGGYCMGVAETLYLQGKIGHKIRYGGAWSGLDKLNTGDQLNDYVHFELIK